MTILKSPSQAELQELERRLAGIPEKERDNHRILALYGYENPLCCRVNAQGKKIPLRRREWIETFIRIRDMSGNIVPLVYKPTQRKLEALTLAIQRKKRPVRILILKARQTGCSTLVEAMDVERSVRRPHSRGLLMAHDDISSVKILRMSHLMRDMIPKTQKDKFVFSMKHKATDLLGWDDPLNSTIQVESAAKGNPAIGDTIDFLHCSEFAMWKDGETKMRSIMPALPSRTGTMAFIESTARGDVGFFRDKFWDDYKRRESPLEQRLESGDFISIFFPWFEEPEYHWTGTYGGGSELPDRLQLEILNSITEEEQWLMEQTYVRRWSHKDKWREIDYITNDGTVVRKWKREGVGPQHVSLDQLAWRRAKIRELNGDPLKPETWDKFNEQYPSRPELAFLATGELFYSAHAIQEMMKSTMDAAFVGEMIDLKPEKLQPLKHDAVHPDQDGDMEKQFRSETLHARLTSK